jgi:hypothetical protein
MSNTIAGNVVAQNCKVYLNPIPFVEGQVSLITYSGSNGAYLFSNVPAGTYQLQASLAETTVAPYNTGYSFRSSVIVTVDAAGDALVDVNLTPVLLNAVNPVTNQR